MALFWIREDFDVCLDVNVVGVVVVVNDIEDAFDIVRFGVVMFVVVVPDTLILVKIAGSSIVYCLYMLFVMFVPSIMFRRNSKQMIVVNGMIGMLIFGSESIFLFCQFRVKM